MKELPGLDIWIAFRLEHCQSEIVELQSGLNYRDQNTLASCRIDPVLVCCKCAEGCLNVSRVGMVLRTAYFFLDDEDPFDIEKLDNFDVLWVRYQHALVFGQLKV